MEWDASKYGNLLYRNTEVGKIENPGHCYPKKKLGCDKINTSSVHFMRHHFLFSLSQKKKLLYNIQKQFNLKISLLLPRPSKSGKRWRICGLGRRYKPHTMQRKARYLSEGQRGGPIIHRVQKVVIGPKGGSQTDFSVIKKKLYSVVKLFKKIQQQ